jgi:isopenicillin N synthase-like dioxygenase
MTTTLCPVIRRITIPLLRVFRKCILSSIANFHTNKLQNIEIMTMVKSLNHAVHHVRRRSRQLLPGSKDERNCSETRSKENSTANIGDKSSEPTAEYEPPDHPPPNYPQQLPLRSVELPLIDPFHRHNLSAQGWTTVTLSSPDSATADLRNSIQSLFSAGKAFFDREEQYKKQFLTKMGSEEGWSSIPGEKEFITIRSLDKVPAELRGASVTAWAQIGSYLNSVLGRVAESLELSPEALTKFSEPCINLGNPRTATMLRLFRYEGWDDKIVAEPHHDLGLLSLVAGSSPGLEVYNGMTRSFFPIEKSYKDLSSFATVLGGRQLQRLTNGRYAPGPHQVRSYPKPNGLLKSSTVGKRFRYSIVFVLRAHGEVTIDTQSLTSRITGTPSMVTDGMPAKAFFDSIRNSHYNINTGIKARELQRKKIEELKSKKPKDTSQDSQTSSINGKLTSNGNSTETHSV